MRRPPRGFTLIEVLVALVVLALSLLGAAAGLALAERVEWRAQARMRVSIALSNRIAGLRAIAGRTDPRCVDMAPGQSGSLPGPVESWDVVDEGGRRRVRVRVRITGRGDITDSVEVFIRCV